ncbi:MAG: metallophosphoesterase [Roseimicrobium sp.]
MSSENRRSFLKRFKYMYAPALVGGGGAYGYGSALERHRLKVERHDLKLALGPRAPKSFRAVSLTDFHFDPLCEEAFVQECVRQANALNPDIVLLTGDYISSTSRRINDFTRIIGGLEARTGVFACLGNHDHWDSRTRVAGALNHQHIAVLQNQHTRVSCNGGELVLAGLQSAWAGQPRWDFTSSGLRQDDRVIALMHEPDFADTLAVDPRVAFQVSGHTHGGQVRVPGWGALILPSWGKRYQAGFYDVGARKSLKLYVNRGIGTISYHVRVFCPPEIACFDVVNTDVA